MRTGKEVISSSNIILLTLLGVAILSTIYTALTQPLIWLEVFLLIALIYGALSPYIVARRLLFLVTASSHAALFSIAIGIIIFEFSHVLSEFVWAVIVSIILINIVGHLMRLGIDPDVATAVFVALTSASSVAAMYYVLQMYSRSYNLWAYMIGDPLLATEKDVIVLSIMAVIIVLPLWLLHDISIYMGVDYDHVRLSLSRLWIYDSLFFTMIALASVTLLKFSGFILEHILFSLPAIIASTISSSSREALALSILSAIDSSLLGLIMSAHLNLAPAAGIGFIVLLLYTIAMVLRRFNHG